jgi:hypothetical protein
MIVVRHYYIILELALPELPPEIEKPLAKPALFKGSICYLREMLHKLRIIFRRWIELTIP